MRPDPARSVAVSRVTSSGILVLPTARRRWPSRALPRTRCRRQESCLRLPGCEKATDDALLGGRRATPDLVQFSHSSSADQAAAVMGPKEQQAAWDMHARHENLWHARVAMLAAIASVTSRPPHLPMPSQRPITTGSPSMEWLCLAPQEPSRAVRGLVPALLRPAYVVLRRTCPGRRSGL